MAGKLINAGQTCIAPDYALVPRARVDDFIAACRAWVGKHYPRLATNPDYATIINDRQFRRLTGWTQTAQSAGATVQPLTDAQPDAARRLLPPIIVTEATGPLAEDEIFGPILPVIGYDSLDQALRFIMERPRPLAFYPFTDDATALQRMLDVVVAGGITINDTLLHVAQPALPFGGVGDSGMGAYHGKAGFDRFSHLTPIFRQARWNGAGLAAPPYGWRTRMISRFLLR